MSFMRMFKSKKNGNKENVPSLNRNSDLRNSMSDVPSSYSSNVYAGGGSTKGQILNPYSVVTEPKLTKGPRSCPGAPMEDRSTRSSTARSLMNSSYGVKPFSDRHSYMNNSVRYENLRDHSQMIPEHYEVPYSRGRCDSRNRDNQSQRERRGHYYESCADSDEDDMQDAKIRFLEAKLSKLQRRYHDEMKGLKREIEIAQEEADYYKRNFDRQSRAYQKSIKSLEMERQQVHRLKKTLKLANDRVNELEDRLAEQSGNDSSLLMCTYGNVNPCTKMGMFMGMPSSGAGEALCSLSDPLTEMREMVNSSTPSLAMFNAEKDDQDTQDEVRVFRTIETDEGEEDEDEAGSPVEKPRKSISPVEEAKPLSPVLLIGRAKPKLQRSLSDTDVNSLSNAEEEPREPMCSTLDREPRRTIDKEFGRGNVDLDMTSGSSSDEETRRVIERQLRKKGEVVKFQPPRAQVQPRHYKRFGKNERTALADFEYLQDMSSDFSGILSSPDVAQQQLVMRR